MFQKSCYNVIPGKSEVLLNQSLVSETFQWVIGNFTKRKKQINWIILGEAPISYSDYFYNPVNDSFSAFLLDSNIKGAIRKKTQQIVKIDSKYDAIMKLIDYNILIVDVYPLPLPSNFYKKDGDFYNQTELNVYWDNIIDTIYPLSSSNTKFAIRYKKHCNSKHFAGFMNSFYKKHSATPLSPICLGSKNMTLDQPELDKLFS